MHYFILEIVSGICCLLAAIFLHYSIVPDSAVKQHYLQGCSFVKMASFLLGTSTLLFAFTCSPEYNLAKTCFIQILLPSETLLVLWSMTYLIQSDSRLERFMMYQTAATLLLCAANAAYFFVFHGTPEQWPYYLLVACNVTQIILYAAIYRYSARLWIESDPGRKAGFMKQPFRIWVASSILGIIGIIASVFPSLVNQQLFTLGYSVFFIFFAIQYHNYGIAAAFQAQAQTATAPEQSDQQDTGRKRHEQSNNLIKEKLETWIQDKGYLQTGITIQDISREIGINRSYLSAYINETYQSNFNGWINNMRIEEAKRKLAEQPDISLNDLAERVGFADQAHFSKQFKLKEGVPPSAWRKRKTSVREPQTLAF